MSKIEPEVFIESTQRWLEQVVIDLNFCPFANKEHLANKIHYGVIQEDQMEYALSGFVDACRYLDQHPHLSTSLLIYPQGFTNFDRYLDLVDLANELLLKENYEGVYQVASFHPDYCFEGESTRDPANYTNRSPFPILHLLREAELEAVLQDYPDPEFIPERNIEKARDLGAEYFEMLLAGIKE